MKQMERKQPYELLPPGSTPLWRFMNVSKFLSLLHKKGLYFSRADTFADKWEGAFSEDSILNQSRLMGVEYPKDLIKLACWVPTHSYVSCWHASEHESMALWEIYSVKYGGVAIKTTIEALSELFPSILKSSEEQLFSQDICAVQYIDYKKEHPYLNDLCGPLCYKRKAYSYEQEIRVIRMELPTVSEPSQTRPNGRSILMAEPPKYTGVSVGVDLSKLIKEVYVAPESPGYLLASLRDITDKYELQVPVHQSELDEIPEYSFKNLTKR